MIATDTTPTNTVDHDGDVLIAGGTLVDVTGERRADVRLSDGSIAEVGDLAPGDGETVIDATGCVVSPGFVDLHVHLREPGQEEAETIQTGSRAAALGGFTAVVAMPNTDPTQDSVSVVDFVRGSGRGRRFVRCAPRRIHHDRSKRSATVTVG